MSAEAARRTTLRRIAAGLAGVAALAAGFVGWAVHRPDVMLAQGRCAGGALVKKRALVVYATRAGSTGEVAQAISECLCAIGFNADAASQNTRAGHTKAVRAVVTPRDDVFFADKIDLATLNFFERMAVKLVKAPVGDKRDWDRIRRWADGLGEKLQ